MRILEVFRYLSERRRKGEETCILPSKTKYNIKLNVQIREYPRIIPGICQLSDFLFQVAMEFSRMLLCHSIYVCFARPEFETLCYSFKPSRVDMS